MRITERYEAVLRQTLARITVGEDDVDYEICIKFADVQGFRGDEPHLAIALTMPGLTPGHRISGWFECSSIGPDPEEIDRRVQTLMTNLRENRLRLVKMIEQATVGGN